MKACFEKQCQVAKQGRGHGEKERRTWKWLAGKLVAERWDGREEATRPKERDELSWRNGVEWWRKVRSVPSMEELRGRNMTLSLRSWCKLLRGEEGEERKRHKWGGMRREKTKRFNSNALWDDERLLCFYYPQQVSILGFLLINAIWKPVSIWWSHFTPTPKIVPSSQRQVFPSPSPSLSLLFPFFEKLVKT